jgi:pimeloyl-ACP methyl ester carboxylesterase
MGAAAGTGARAPDVPAVPVPDADDGFTAREIDLHGHRVIYRTAGAGPPVVLIHGMVNSSRHWKDVALTLAEDYRVVAPDLLGHGDSAKPVGDYSLGAHASGIRDLLTALGVERATVVGHSLGGGVAMQFYYQFPERCERLALVSSGGLGREVSWLLRLAAVPGVGGVLGLAASGPSIAGLRHAAAGLRRRDRELGVYLEAAARALGALDSRGARRAFLCTLRSVIDTRGQRVSARDRLYLAGAVPTLIVWGGRDRTIPIEHGRAARAEMPGSELVILPRAAHFPHLEDPAGLGAALRDFLATTEPARLAPTDWSRLLASRPAGNTRS